MEYTSFERRKKLMELALSDADCTGAGAEIDPARQLLEEYTDALSTEVGSLLWAYPTALHTYYHRLLDLVCEHMHFPEES